MQKLQLKFYFLSLVLGIGIISSSAFGYGTGISTFPLPAKNGALTTEFTNFFSNGAGVGLQARYLHRFSQLFALEGTVGASDSSRSKRFSLAGDFELYPDYESSPRFALHPFVEIAKEFSRSNNIFGIYPILSKGYVFKNHIGYPFIAVPISMAFSSNSDSYEFRMGMTVGITGKIPFSQNDRLLLNLEANIDIHNSFTAALAGFSYQL
ncbi:MAG: hypothetical protein HQK53_08000 [Oligoflexia bacterium]|nr:hypothetical protein [Oligoflexia bacterium]